MKQLALKFWPQINKEIISSSDFKITNKSEVESKFDLTASLKILIEKYFPSQPELYEYSIKWSSRKQKRTLASCNLRAKKIIVAKELDDPRYYQYLNPLIYHELCHAALGFSVYSKTSKSRWHGKEFKSLERLHPEINLLNNWIKSGGWRQAVRSHRAKDSAKKKTYKKRINRFSFKFFKALISR